MSGYETSTMLAHPKGLTCLEFVSRYKMASIIKLSSTSTFYLLGQDAKILLAQIILGVITVDL